MESIVDYEAQKIIGKALPYSRALLMLVMDVISEARKNGIEVKVEDAVGIAQLAIDLSEVATING